MCWGYNRDTFLFTKIMGLDVVGLRGDIWYDRTLYGTSGWLTLSRMVQINTCPFHRDTGTLPGTKNRTEIERFSLPARTQLSIQLCNGYIWLSVKCFFTPPSSNVPNRQISSASLTAETQNGVNAISCLPFELLRFAKIVPAQSTCSVWDCAL